MHKLILETELVPETCWYTNLRSILTQKNWRMLSQAVRERSGGVCPICGMETPMEELDAHETWGYNDITHEQYVELCDYNSDLSVKFGVETLPQVENRARNIINELKEKYNEENNITPRSIVKEISEVIHSKETKEMTKKYREKKKHSKAEKEKLLASIEAEMRQAAKQLNFERAAELRDILYELRDEN